MGGENCSHEIGHELTGHGMTLLPRLEIPTAARRLAPGVAHAGDLEVCRAVLAPAAVQLVRRRAGTGETPIVDAITATADRNSGRCHPNLGCVHTMVHTRGTALHNILYVVHNVTRR